MLIDKRGYNVKLYYSAVKNISAFLVLRSGSHNNNNNSPHTCTYTPTNIE